MDRRGEDVAVLTGGEWTPNSPEQGLASREENALMPSAAGPEIDVAAPSAEETLRAACYRLLARFLALALFQVARDQRAQQLVLGREVVGNAAA